MRILVLSFYYLPDLSAGAFRTTSLVSALVEQMPSDATVDVITTMPNRYATFDVAVPAVERNGAVTIRRVGVSAHNSGFVDQSRAFFAFARGAMRLVGRDRYDLVYATSSRLMTAVLGRRLATKSGAPLYLDIRDIFVDTIRDVLPRPMGATAAPIFSSLERHAIGGAAKVNLVSEGFTEYFRKRYPRQRYSFFPNGIDDDFLAFADDDHASPARDERQNGHGISTVVYAGNIGEGQGLHSIIPPLALRMSDRARFRLIGDGGRRRELEAAVSAAALTNVTLLPPMSRHDLLDEYRAADVLLLHLNAYSAFQKVLPSKVFEYAATGKPIWAGVSGYAARFLDTHVENAAVFRPCDVAGAVAAFDALKLSWTRRAAFNARFSRRSINVALAGDILAVARPARAPG